MCLNFILRWCPDSSDLFHYLSAATPGSDSPGQAMEAEEIMKQLDIEQAEEMPSSTLTSTEGITPCHTAPILPQRLQMTPDTSIEEGEIVTEADMPPLTGMTALMYDLTSHLERRQVKQEIVSVLQKKRKLGTTRD